MMRCISKKMAVALCFAMYGMTPAFAQTAQIDCSGTISSWRNDARMRDYMRDHDCDCRNGARSAPVCSKRSSGGSHAAPRSTTGSGSRVTQKKRPPSTKQMMQKEMIKSFGSMMNSSQNTEAAGNEGAAENAQRIYEAHEAGVKSVEERRQQAARRQAAAGKASAHELSQELQGLPVTQTDPGISLDTSGTTTQGTSAGRQLKSAVFHGERAVKATSPEAAREEASNVFDTPGKNVGKLKSIQKPMNAENIPPEKMTPKIKQWVEEREGNRKKKKALEEKLEKLRAKEKLEPNETVEVVKLQQEISTSQNKENYYNFSINDELAKPVPSEKK